MLKSVPFCAYCISSFLSYFGVFTGMRFLNPSPSSTLFSAALNTVLIYIGASGEEQGVSTRMSFYLNSIANGSGAFGRLLAGYISDRLGGFRNIL